MFYILTLFGLIPGLFASLIEGAVKLIGALTGAAPVLIAGLMLGGLTGCSLIKGPSDLMQAGADVGKTVATKIADEGVLNDWLTALDGHVQDPGVEHYVELRAATGTRVVGANGNVTATAGGDSTRLPAGVREELIKQLSLPISDEQRNAILTTLGWNRTLPGGG